MRLPILNIFKTSLVFLAVLLCAPLAVAGSLENCTFNGIPLYGKVKFVDNFADIKIKFTDSFADIDVQFVDNFPTSCGKWQVVDNFEDFSVEVVSAFEDLKVKKVDFFPGVN